MPSEPATGSTPADVPHDGNEESVVSRDSVAGQSSASDHRDTASTKPEPKAPSDPQPLHTPSKTASNQHEKALDKVPTSRSRLEELIVDLKQQVTGLNGKLVRSFERMADLEDDLVDVRGQLGSNNQQIDALEKEQEEHLEALNTGLLVEKQHVSSEMQKLMDRVLEETQQRGKAESDRNKIEAELDELSAKFFSEANRMVAVERLARARAEGKSEQLEKSLKNTELVMVEQQKILASLQQQIEQLEHEAQSEEIVEKESTSASEGALPGKGPGSESEEPPPMHISSLVRTPSDPSLDPAKDTRFLPLSLLRQQVQINVEAFREFIAFLSFLRRQRLLLKPFYEFTQAPARKGTPPLSDPLRGMATGPISPFAPNLGLQTPSNPFQAAGVGRHKDFPLLPANADALVQVSNQLSQPFLKRMQEEDSDPCLRLDLAPGLGWLNRRTAHTAILDGHLVIEPLFPGGVVPDDQDVRARTAHLPVATCALCGTAVVNIPLGGLEPSLTLGSKAGSTRERKISSKWASSLTGSATSLLETAGMRHPKPQHATISGELGSLDLEAPSSPSSAQQEDVSPPSPRRPSAPPSHTSTVSDKTNSSSAAANSTPKGRNLFGTFRIGTSSPKPARVQTPASTFHLSRLGSFNTGTTSAEELEEANGTQYRFDPPIPTHIFRMSEEASARYLICPHHCLARLRAACAFWSFVRRLEREIVLEGKQPWEDGKALLNSENGDKPNGPHQAASLTPEVQDQDQILKHESGLDTEVNETEKSRQTDASGPNLEVNGLTASDSSDASGETQLEQKKEVGVPSISERQETSQGSQSLSSSHPSGTTTVTHSTSSTNWAAVEPNDINTPSLTADPPDGVSEVDSTVDEKEAPSETKTEKGDPHKLAPPPVPPRHPNRSASTAPSAAPGVTTSSAPTASGTPALTDAADTATPVQDTSTPAVYERPIINLDGHDYPWAHRLWQEVVQHKLNMALCRLGFHSLATTTVPSAQD